MTTMWYVTRYQHSWGRGATPEEAKRRAREAGGRGTTWYTVAVPAGAGPPWVDAFGSVCWEWESDVPDDYEPGGSLPIVAAGRGCSKDLRDRVVV